MDAETVGDNVNFENLHGMSSSEKIGDGSEVISDLKGAGEDGAALLKSKISDEPPSESPLTNGSQVNENVQNGSNAADDDGASVGTEETLDSPETIEQLVDGNDQQVEVAEESNTLNSDSEVIKNDKDDGDATEHQQEIAGMAKDMIENILGDARSQVLREEIEKSHDSSNDALHGHETTATKESENSEKKKDDDWMDVLGNGLLRKKVITAGEGFTTRPKRENEVVIKFEAKIKDCDDIVDSDTNLTFVLGEQEVIQAFDLAVALMEKGEKCLLESDAKYAYEAEGKLPNIPPNASLLFEIELLEINEGPFSSDVSTEKRLVWADGRRQKGNEYYLKNKYTDAAMAYMRASKALEKGWMNENSEEGKSQINALRIKCYNNLSACHMKLQKWKEALQTCIAAEKLEPENVKTLFRKGKIHCELGQLEKGIQSLTKASKLEPDNKIIAAELAKQNKNLEFQTNKQKEMYQRMLGKAPEKKPEMNTPEKSWLSSSWGRVLGGTLALGAVLVGVYVAQKM